jgi:hypothetical protein
VLISSKILARAPFAGPNTPMAVDIMNVNLTHAAPLAKLSHLDQATVHHCSFIGSEFAIMSMIISYLQQQPDALTGTY